MNKLFDSLMSMPDKLAHIIICLIGTIFFGFGFGLGASLGAEFKDKAHGGKWDWADFTAGMFGTFCGTLIHILIIREIWQIFV